MKTQMSRTLIGSRPLVREMLTSHLAVHPETARQRLAAMEGIGADTSATGQDHDTVLYNTKR